VHGRRETRKSIPVQAGEELYSWQPKLLSLAASDPCMELWVVRWTSSSLVQVSGDGDTSSDQNNTPFLILDNCNHKNIVEIEDETHPAFAHITRFFSKGWDDQPVSQPSGDPYFTVVLSKEPQSGYPILWSMQNTQLEHIYDSIDDDAYHAVIFEVTNVGVNQYIQIEYAPGKQRERGKLTKGQSTIRINVIQN
jgi:hypothetical protein